MAYIELNQVTRRFNAITAVDRLDLTIDKGECVAMLGPSGCGKTTTLRMVAGFEDLDDGEIRVGDRLISSAAKRFYTPPEHRNFGMVFQAFAVWPHLTIFENVAFPLRVRKLPREEIKARTVEALTHTNLLDVAEGSPDDLSGGGKQRVALARALAIRPDVMLLDEPLSSLDPHFREEMRFEIKDLQRRFGYSILYVTHDQAEAMALSDRILVMKNGVVQQVGTPLDVYSAPANRFVFEFIGLSSFLDVALTPGAMQVAGQSAPPARLAAFGTRRRRSRRAGGAPERDLLRRRRHRRHRRPQGLSGRGDRLSGERRRRRGARADLPSRRGPGDRGDLPTRIHAAALVSAGRARGLDLISLVIPGRPKAEPGIQP